MSFARVMYLMHQGASLTQAVDHTAVHHEGIAPEAWAEVRNVTPRAVEKSLTDCERAVPAIADDGPSDVEQSELDP